MGGGGGRALGREGGGGVEMLAAGTSPVCLPVHDNVLFVCMSRPFSVYVGCLLFLNELVR